MLPSSPMRLFNIDFVLSLISMSGKSQSEVLLYYLCSFILKWVDGWMDLLVGTGVATALRIVQWILNRNCNLLFLPKLHITCSLRCHPNKSALGNWGWGVITDPQISSIDKKKICGFISFFGDQSHWLFESLWWNWALDEKYFPADICSPPSPKEIFEHWNIY